jgi:hypothetical protein
MSYETIDMWLYEPADGACDTCAGMQGVYTYAVQTPHPNCKCVVTTGSAKAELISTRDELVDQYEVWEEITWVPRGGESSLEQNWSTGTETSVTGEGSAEEGGFGITVSETDTNSAAVGGSRSVTFNYDDAVGGQSQLIAAVYQVKLFQRIETYRAHWSEGAGADFEFEVIAATREERAFAGYRTVAF